MYKEYSKLHGEFVGKNIVFNSREGNGVIKYKGKGFGFENGGVTGLTYDRLKDIYKDKVESIDIDKMGAVDLVILLRVLFGIVPIVGDIVGGYDDFNQASAGINFDGSTQKNWEKFLGYGSPILSVLSILGIGYGIKVVLNSKKYSKVIETITKVINKLSKNKEMLKDIAKNEKFMQMLGAMKGVIPKVVELLDKIKSQTKNVAKGLGKKAGEMLEGYRLELYIQRNGLILGFTPDNLKIGTDGIMTIGKIKLQKQDFLQGFKHFYKTYESQLLLSLTTIYLIYLIYYVENPDFAAIIDYFDINYDFDNWEELGLSMTDIKSFRELPTELQLKIREKAKYILYKKIAQSHIFDSFKIEIEKNPEFDLNDFLLKYLLISRQYNPYLKENDPKMINILKKYQRRYNEVRNYYLRMKGNGRNIIEDLYGMKTKEDVKVEIRGAAIICWMENTDYEKLFPNNSGGISTEKLNGGFIAIRKQYYGTKYGNDTIVHEIQHSDDKLVNWREGNIEHLLKTEIVARIKEGKNIIDSKMELLDEEGAYNYYEFLAKKDTIKQYFKMWNSHKRKTEFYINIAFKVKEEYGNITNFLLSFTDIDQWEKLL